jgi:hypothetical protein
MPSPAFDLIAETSSGAQRKTSNIRLGGTAISALRHAYEDDLGNMPPEQLADLEEFVAKAKALATPAVNDYEQESLLSA